MGNTHSWGFWFWCQAFVRVKMFNEGYETWVRGIKLYVKGIKHCVIVWSLFKWKNINKKYEALNEEFAAKLRGLKTVIIAFATNDYSTIPKNKLLDFKLIWLLNIVHTWIPVLKKMFIICQRLHRVQQQLLYTTNKSQCSFNFSQTQKKNEKWEERKKLEQKVR